MTELEQVSRPADAAVVVAAEHRRAPLTGLVLLLIVVACSFLIPVISPYSPNQVDAAASLRAPSWPHLLGTDSFGRDVLVRICEGYKISLLVSVSSVALGSLVGVPLGLLAAVGGRLSRLVIMRPLDVLMSFPTVVLAIIVTAILGKGTLVLTVAIAIACVPNLARVMEGEASATERQLYILAARTRGASTGRLIARHILPNSLGPVITQAFLLMGQAALLEAGLSYLGLGVNPPTASLGLMLAQGQEFMEASAWVVIGPGVGIFILVLSFLSIGTGLHQVTTPRARRGR